MNDSRGMFFVVRPYDSIQLQTWGEEVCTVMGSLAALIEAKMGLII